MLWATDDVQDVVITKVLFVLNETGFSTTPTNMAMELSAWPLMTWVSADVSLKVHHVRQGN